MFTQRAVQPQPQATKDAGATPFVIDGSAQSTDPEEELRRRHAVLMECLEDERDRQSEERMQAAIDEDMYDHLHWRQEDAAVLIDRGQLPLVFNESRQTVDWIAGTEKRMRKDYKILPREPGDEQGAEIKTQVVKYTDDVNLTAWHRSRVFKQMAISGLGWLEEGINIAPDEEIIFAGSEDWRNVYRDSRSRQFDLKDGRYLFRRKVTDVDYAIALLPKSKEHLRNMAQQDDTVDSDDVWYVGERLTGASDILVNDGLPSGWRDRRAYMMGNYIDQGRRRSVELLECWYRVPETVDVFSDGPQYGKVVNKKDPGHQQLLNDRTPYYSTVKMCMRVMIATKDKPLWDGRSPFKHNSFLLVPMWGYRRYRDGMTYGSMRGMRDLQDDMNKRASKALWLLSSNRIIMEDGAVDDIELAREEAARPDGIMSVKATKRFEFVKHTAEVQGNLEMMDRDAMAMRNVGGVTDENLGRETPAQSGIAIQRKQDQGSLTTSELFDNRQLAVKLAGQLRLSHIEQFKTAPDIIRIIGEGKPLDWLQVNQVQPDGSILNDLTAREADFIVSETDYRESYARASLDAMGELLQQIATFAPQVVMAVLDLFVEGSEVPNKTEWVQRIRKLNGQRDPTKAPTPQEQQQEFAAAQKAALQDQLGMATLKAQLDEIVSKAKNMDAKTIETLTNSMFAALQAAQIVAITPAVAPIGDSIMAGAGFKDQGGQDPNLPVPPQGAAGAPPGANGAPPDQGAPNTVPLPTDGPASGDPQPPVSAAPQQLAGVHQGIETPRASDNGPPQA